MRSLFLVRVGASRVLKMAGEVDESNATGAERKTIGRPAAAVLAAATALASASPVAATVSASAAVGRRRLWP